jgi:hypothetical protein
MGVEAPPLDRISLAVDITLINRFYLPVTIAITFAEVIRKFLTMNALAAKMPAFAAVT